jgi:hypothetical protein
MRKPLLLLSAALLALAALYAAAGYWLLPGYVRQHLVAEAASRGYELKLEAVRTDPFRLSAELLGAELALAEDLRVHARKVLIDLRLASLLARDWLPQRISLVEASIDLADSRIQPIGATLDREPAGYRIVSEGVISMQGDLVLAPLKLDATLAASGLPLATRSHGCRDSLEWRSIRVPLPPVAGCAWTAPARPASPIPGRCPCSVSLCVLPSQRRRSHRGSRSIAPT